MRYPPAETAEKHARILAEAARLFRERGFDGAGVAEVMKAAGLTHGAFYAHFESKDALAAATVGCAIAESLQTFFAPASAAPDPRRHFLGAYLSPLHRDRPGQGCVTAALGPEVARHGAARATFTKGLRQTLSIIRGWFGSGPDEAAAERQAIRLFSAAVGALILARAVDDPALSDRILASLQDDA